jgi:Ino eighty subunit 1
MTAYDAIKDVVVGAGAGAASAASEGVGAGAASEGVGVAASEGVGVANEGVGVANEGVGGAANEGSGADGADPGRRHRHLKKRDGEPFWRRDIQYDFQRFVFGDERRVFTNPFPDPQIAGFTSAPRCTFAELYIRTLAELNKCSKILKERLLKDRDMGVGVLKVCLLVNLGRMNTTINFVPEMRLTLRTYHLIPLLQADPVHGGLKPLQDTPRLKLILKLVSEGDDATLEDVVRGAAKPNVVNLIFLLSTYARGVPYLDDGPESTFMDFFLNTLVHPQSRAQRFLWLMYAYLETSFAPDELRRNPFGDGAATIPPPRAVSEAEARHFDVDEDYERAYAAEMVALRQRYLTDEDHNNTPKRGNKSRRDKEDDEELLANHQASEAAGEATGDAANTEAAALERKHALDEERLDASEERKRARRAPAPPARLALSPLGQSMVSRDAPGAASAAGAGAAAPTPIASSHYGNNGVSSPFTPLGAHTIRMKQSDHCPAFPIPAPQLDALRRQATSPNPEPLHRTSMALHLSILNKSKPLIRLLRSNAKVLPAEFSQRADELRAAIARYFEYQKLANGVLGMEYENLRYDLANGIETLVNQQYGQAVHAQLQTRNPGARFAEQQTPSTLALVNGGAAAAAAEAADDAGFGVVPIYDFNTVNQLNALERDVLAVANAHLAAAETRLLQRLPPRGSGYVKFDLERGQVDVDLEFY